MFSGIVEGLGKILRIQPNGSNRIFKIRSPFREALKEDQSLAHNGVCLTVEALAEDHYQVTAVRETLAKSNLGLLEVNDFVNLERSLTLGSFVDGHLVQGHVDATGRCEEIKNADGSHIFRFSYDAQFAPLLVEKGSITVNGVSLTAFDVTNEEFKVAVIPYTYEHTNLQFLKSNDPVNLEFDLIGKYVWRQNAFKR